MEMWTWWWLVDKTEMLQTIQCCSYFSDEVSISSSRAYPLGIFVRGSNMNMFLHIISVVKIELKWISFC